MLEERNGNYSDRKVSSSERAGNGAIMKVSISYFLLVCALARDSQCDRIEPWGKRAPNVEARHIGILPSHGLTAGDNT